MLDFELIFETIPWGNRDEFNSQDCQQNLNSVDWLGTSLLMLYVVYAEPISIKVIEHITSQPTFDINHTNTSGVSALGYAASFCAEYEVFKLLINKGADVNQLDKSYRSTLGQYLSKVNHDPRTVELFLKHGFDVK